MYFEENYIYHIYNRGNNRELIFHSDENYRFFLRKIRREIQPISEILAYCLMPDHFHLLIQANNKSCESYRTNTGRMLSEQTLVKKIALLLSSYTKAINKQENRKGGLFQPKTKAKQLNFSKGKIDYLFTCFQYIHQNPLHAGLVTKIENWPYSSFIEYLNRIENGLCNIGLIKEMLNFEEEDFYDLAYLKPDEHKLKDIF